MASAASVAPVLDPAANDERDSIEAILMHLESAEVRMRVAHQALASTLGAIHAATAELAGRSDPPSERLLREDFAG
jgi:hypothetical protein